MENSNQSALLIEKIYTKDVSFECFKIFELFKKWDPEIKIDLDTKYEKLENDFFEVELLLTVNLKNCTQNVYLIEVSQVGVFTLRNIDKEQINIILETYCPNTLFPYAKEMIENLVNKGGFPQINLSPVNFDAIYMNKKNNQIKH